MSDLVISDSVVVRSAELEFSFSRSPGPGGQNVNKVNSQATLKWRAADSTALAPAPLQRFLQQNRNRINKLGELVITSHEHRDQRSNVDACRERLAAMIRQALVVPRKRKATQPTKGSVRRRLTDKKLNSAKKNFRRGDGGD